MDAEKTLRIYYKFSLHSNAVVNAENQTFTKKFNQKRELPDNLERKMYEDLRKNTDSELERYWTIPWVLSKKSRSCKRNKAVSRENFLFYNDSCFRFYSLNV